jgi:gamma-tubulin complex component 4
MLAELLLVLSGLPSSFFVPSPAPPAIPTTLSVSPSLSQYLHPGETSSLNTLGILSFRYSQIREWALVTQLRARQAVLASHVKGKQKAIDGEVDPYLSTLAGSVLDALSGYEVLIVTTEARILSVDRALVQDHQGYVPLSSLVATFSSWQSPMAALASLVDNLSSGEWPAGRLLELVYDLTRTGNPKLEGIFTKLLEALQHLFLTHLVTFLLHGLAPTTSLPTSPSIALDIGPDPLSPQHRIYALNDSLIPPSIRGGTRESILYVGRVAATLRREGRSLPTSLVDGLRENVMGVKGLDEGGGLNEAIQRTRAEVGE